MISYRWVGNLIYSAVGETPPSRTARAATAAPATDEPEPLAQFVERVSYQSILDRPSRAPDEPAPPGSSAATGGARRAGTRRDRAGRRGLAPEHRPGIGPAEVVVRRHGLEAADVVTDLVRRRVPGPPAGRSIAPTAMRVRLAGPRRDPGGRHPPRRCRRGPNRSAGPSGRPTGARGAVRAAGARRWAAGVARDVRSWRRGLGPLRPQRPPGAGHPHRTRRLLQLGLLRLPAGGLHRALPAGPHALQDGVPADRCHDRRVPGERPRGGPPGAGPHSGREGDAARRGGRQHPAAQPRLRLPVLP